MAYVLTDALILFGGYNLSGDLNKVGLSMTAGEEEDTTFGDSFRSRPGGQLADVSVSAEGWWQSATLNAPDPQIATALGSAGTVLTVADVSTTGATAYLCGVHVGSYSQSDTVGSVRPFTFESSGSSTTGPVRGRLLLPVTSLTGSTTGTGYQLGAVGSTQYLHTSVHVTVAGTTADVIVESDDNSNFTSATTRSTTTVTAVGGTRVTPVAGAITDDYWRVRVANVTGTFSIAVAVGIK